ncbi:MAG: MFS transporter [Bacteroidales bacterium]
MVKHFKRNLVCLYVIKVSGWLMLYMPVVKLFYEENGLGDYDLFILHAIYSLIIALLEIPSGYFADRMGRKISLLLGALFGFFGFGTYSLFHGFSGFIMAEILLGIGQSFISGSDSAMLYDTLLDSGKAKKYMKYEGRISAAGNFAEASAGLVIFLLIFSGMSTYRIPYYLQTFVALMAIPAALLLTEPGRHKNLVPVKLARLFDIVKYALFENKPLRNHIIFSSIIGFSTLTMAWFAQIYFYRVHLNESLFPVFWTLLNLTVGIGSVRAYRIEKYLGMKKTVLLVLLFISSGFFLNAIFLSIPAILLLFVFYFVRGIATPVLKDYINRLTTSDIRATVLSVRSLIIRILFSAIGPLLGWMSDNISLRMALLMCGFTVLLTGGITIAAILRSIKQTPLLHTPGNE